MRASNEAHFCKLFEAGSQVGRVIRFVSQSLAARRVNEGKWREVFYEDDLSPAGYQPVASVDAGQARARTGRQVVIDMAKAATITLTETRMVAGEFGRSRTAGMPEWKRERRVRRAQEFRRIVALDDAIELAQEKVRLWPYPANVIGQDQQGKPVYGDKAVRVYPKS